MKKLTAVIAMSIFLLKCYSQDSLYTITGAISDKNNKLIESGYAIALHPKDSSIIKGTFFMEGKFRLQEIGIDSVILKLSSIGYTDFLKKIKRSGKDTLLNAGNILLGNTGLLKEVTVSAKIPLFENDGEKVKINVANSNLGSGGTAMDVLRKSPGIMVTGNNKVSIIGKGEPLIYIDGQRISSIEILKNLPANEIQSIEVIRHPSAKYDAAGSAVINIITKKASLQGYNGSVMQNYIYGKNLYLLNEVQLNVSKGKWSGNSSYGFNEGKTWDSNKYTRKFSENDSTISMDNSVYQLQHCVGRHVYHAGVTCRPDSINTIGISYHGFSEVTDFDVDNTNSIYKESLKQADLATRSKQRYSGIYNNATAMFTRKSDTLGSELSANVNGGNLIIRSNSGINQNVTTQSSIADQQKRNIGYNRVDFLSANADLKKVFNRRWSFETGFKETYANKTGGTQFENLSGNTWVPDSDYVTGFNLKENVVAAYAELRYKKGKFNSRAGLRSEQTYNLGFSKILNTEVFHRNYINLFPSAFVSYDLPHDLKAGITYSSRIRRPGYEALDPFVDYVDSLSSERGNPFLLPDYTTSLEASLIVDDEISLLTFGYSRTNGAITDVVEKVNDGSNSFVMTVKNIDYKESYSIGVTLPWEEEWFTTANSVVFFWNTFSYRQSGQVVQNFSPMLYVYLYGELRLRKLFSLEAEYEYYSPGADGIFNFNAFSMLSMSIKKSFFNNKLTCMFSANDLLRGYREWGKSRVPGYDISYYSLYNTHNFSLQLTWSFGKLKSKEKERPENEEETHRIKMQK